MSSVLPHFAFDTRVIETLPTSQLKPYRGNARTHSKAQICQIARSIERFGFTNPILISDDHEIIAGHGRVEAAKSLGLHTVPTLRLSHLTATQRRAYMLADNKLGLNAGWDRQLLAIELQSLADLDFEVDLTGFSTAEIDLVLDIGEEKVSSAHAALEDIVPPLPELSTIVTRPGDLWLLGKHRLICADMRQVCGNYPRP